MDDVHFKSWRIFFKEAGLTKLDQVKYAQSFTSNKVEMKSFCCMVSQHTDSSISFMKSLDVKPAGHQIRISNQARKYETANQTQFSYIKIESEEQNETHETSPDYTVTTLPTADHHLPTLSPGHCPRDEILNPLPVTDYPASTSEVITKFPHPPVHLMYKNVPAPPPPTVSDVVLPNPEPRQAVEKLSTPVSSCEDEKLYCYCQCPYDRVSSMIGCDAPRCRLQWFHFKCVGIKVPPKGKWYCLECTTSSTRLQKEKWRNQVNQAVVDEQETSVTTIDLTSSKKVHSKRKVPCTFCGNNLNARALKRHILTIHNFKLFDKPKPTKRLSMNLIYNLRPGPKTNKSMFGREIKPKHK